MSDLDFVRSRLRESKGQWLRISRETGVAHRAIYNVVKKDSHDPRSSTVDALARWFRDRDASPPAAPPTAGDPAQARAA